MSIIRFAIIGNGMVGHRVIEELLDKAAPNQFAITVFGEEPALPTTASISPLTFPTMKRNSCRWYKKAGINSKVLRF